MVKRKNYKESLLRDLQDPELASAYLEEALHDEDIHVFLLALRNVAEARGGMGKIAEKAHLNRVSLYKTLSQRGCPKLPTLLSILEACGLEIGVKPITS